MKRETPFLGLFLAFIGLLMWSRPVQAQMKLVEINVLKEINGGMSKEPMSNVNVYGFMDLRKASDFIKKSKSLAFTPKPSDFDCYEKTNADGFCNLELPLDGVVVVIPPFGEPKSSKVNSRETVTILYKEDEMGKILQEVVKTVRVKRDRQPIVGVRTGDTKSIRYKLPIYSQQARSDVRCGFAPICIEVQTRDTFCIYPPVILDGSEYHQTQTRRMGYDLQHDSLSQYAYTNRFMRTREEDSLIIDLKVSKMKENHNYKVYGTFWFEDYNHVISRDSICLDEGNDLQPMRFLEYSTIHVDIDKERYKREGRVEQRPVDHRLNLNFMTGKAMLDPNDSMSFVQLEELKSAIARYANDPESGITGIQIAGQASPEGGVELNERLCRARSEYLSGQLQGAFPHLSRKLYTVSARVATWAEVADLLEKDSLKTYAEEVRAIVEKNKNTRTQESFIRQLPYFNMIKDTILPKLRIVDVRFYCYTRRVKNREEIYQQYLSDEGYRQGKKQQPYEFYNLFDMVKTDKELETLAYEARKVVRDEGQQRPWALAAYHLAQCYLKRDVCDTAVLSPYLDWDYVTALPEYQLSSPDGAKLSAYNNDEAIVATQIAMLCKMKSYNLADSMAHNLLANKPEYDTLKAVLRCLRGGWGEPEVRDMVAGTSMFNKALVYAAQRGDEIYEREALDILENPKLMNQNDPKVLYMIACLRYRIEAENKGRKVFPELHFKKDTQFEPDPNDPRKDIWSGEYRQDWGYPMVRCCQIDKKYLDYMLNDGEFPKAYRESFMAYWNKLNNKEQTSPATSQQTNENKQ